MMQVLLVVLSLFPTPYLLLPTAECVHEPGRVAYWKQAEVMPGVISEVKTGKETSEVLFVTRTELETHIETLTVDDRTKIYAGERPIIRSALEKERKGLWLAFYCSQCRLVFQMERREKQ